MSVESPDRFEDEEGAAVETSPDATNGANGTIASDEDVGGQKNLRTEALGDDAEDEEGDDLFGDEDEEDDGRSGEPAKRHLDDAELDSGDDEGRIDRVEIETEQFEEREMLTMDIEVSRQAVPEPSDGEMYLLKVPPFMSIEPQAWQTTTFQPPATEHHSKKPPTATFSAYETALTTIRWRHSPSNPAELQSNARINRWSDGSLTLQLASDPSKQYEIEGNPLAPPQRNPIKPTPTSVLNAGQKGGRHGAASDEKYDYSHDAFTYLIVPVEQAEALRVTHKVTAGLKLKQTEAAEDDAIEKLQAALASAANATKVGGATGQLEVTEVDPELQRKQAELAEKQQIRDRRKREHAQERERMRADRALGRSGLSSGRYGGLNVGMLEDEEMEGGRGRSQTTKSRAKPRRRRNSEYSEDEDMGRRRFTREDSYDEEDDFVANSDEEEIVEDDEDPDDGIIEEPRERAEKRDRPQPPISAEISRVGDEEDAEGEPDDDLPQARAKRRRVVDEDEDEE